MGSSAEARTMPYAPASDYLEAIVYERVAASGYGPYYQREAWKLLQPMPMPSGPNDWVYIWRFIDERYPKPS